MKNRLLLALAIWSVFGIVCLISERAHGSEVYSEVTGVTDKPDQDGAAHAAHKNGQRRTPPPGLAKVMSEGAGRVVNPTCDDVRAVVAWIGEARAVEMAREAGASNSQIDKARRCLK
jgi:hypothetical protein